MSIIFMEFGVAIDQRIFYKLQTFLAALSSRIRTYDYFSNNIYKDCMKCDLNAFLVLFRVIFYRLRVLSS